MRREVTTSALWFALCVAHPISFAGGEMSLRERRDWGKFFEEAGVHGCFLLYDLQNDSLHVYNPARMDSGCIPASTFKIPNSLIALETGVVRNEHDTIAWDGVQRFVPRWNADHDMSSAFQYSTVWFYQELARRIGHKRMQQYIDAIRYGNRDIGGGIDLFWLEGDLRITPREQITFLVRLRNNELPFSLETMSTVRRIMIVEQTESYVLRAKTGWGARLSPEIGWYVGYVERGGSVWFFANNIDMRKDEDAEARIGISRRILGELGLIDPTSGQR